MAGARELVHGTCVALGKRAALLRGPSGAGKSDLALRFLALSGEDEEKALLVADDQVFVGSNGSGELVASAPPTIAGKIEVRGLGIIEVPTLAEARLTLVCDLVGTKEVPRLPPHPWERTVIAGVPVPLIKLDPFEASAPAKLKMALLWATRDLPN
ncbi:MAG: HPr kinase/phosphatase C-terminal domain-containing protein [Methyloceanibacter sp.]